MRTESHVIQTINGLIQLFFRISVVHQRFHLRDGDAVEMDQALALRKFVPDDQGIDVLHVRPHLQTVQGGGNVVLFFVRKEDDFRTLNDDRFFLGHPVSPLRLTPDHRFINVTILVLTCSVYHNRKGWVQR